MSVEGVTRGQAEAPVSPASPAHGERLHWAFWWIPVCGYSVLSGAIAGIYAGLGLEPPTDAQPIQYVLFFAAIAVWFTGYSRKHRLRPPLDMGMFLAIAYYIFIPYYIYRVEGRRGARTLGLLLLLIVVSFVLRVLVSAVLGGFQSS